jgi:hypothetical protein
VPPTIFVFVLNARKPITVTRNTSVGIGRFTNLVANLYQKIQNLSRLNYLLGTV